MAATRKYAGLPDLDPAPEIYETPELTDDASTVQTSTLRTDSPSPSEEGRHTENFDRARLNQEQARRRFEPSIVSAKDTNLSDAVGRSRKGYSTTHRRRRRRRAQHYDDDEDPEGELSDLSSEEEETLSRKLARLRREAEEVKLELERIEREGDIGAPKDETQQQQTSAQQIDRKELSEGVDELDQVLKSLKVTSKKPKGETLEEEFSRQLVQEKRHKSQQQPNGNTSSDIDSTNTASPSAISAIAAFSDRLTSLETALGLSVISPNTNPSSIIPSLDHLTVQIDGLTSIIDPKTTQTNAQKDHIEHLTNRLHALHIDADRLLNTRKAALQALTQLHEARYSGAGHNSTVFAQYLSRREARERQRDSQNLDSHDTDNDNDDDNNNAATALNDTDRSRSKSKDNKQKSGDRDILATEDRIVTSIFLEEQSSKITALYNTLPTIQNLQPLLPVVLERLRGLSALHASASTAQTDMVELENRLTEWEKELGRWSLAVENVEKGIEECKVVMKENVDIVGEMVRSLEGRVDELLKTVK